MNFRYLAALILTLLIALATAFATLTPPAAMPRVAGSDKLYHLLAFAALALPVASLVPRRIPLAMLVLTLYGAAIEMLQPLAGRSRDLDDQMANMAGICLGVLAGLVLYALIFRPRNTERATDHAGAKSAEPTAGSGQPG